MQILQSYMRIMDKDDEFAKIFGYRLTFQMPKAAVLGPQEESDEFEAKLDRCIADKVDYFAEEFGYNPEEERAEVEKNKYIFID